MQDTRPSPVLVATVRTERFELKDLIGRGGMGDVFRAWDRELEVEVALKSLRQAAAREPRVLARFKTEVKLARRIKHVNVAQVYDLAEQGGCRYLSMEFVEGKTLAAILKTRGGLPLHVALGLMRQICSGVQAAHDEGVTHRDLKPQNVMIRRRNGRACILDFGIAREEGGTEEATEVGVILGSPQYMSYEQLAGLPVGPRSDVFQLGILLFEMVTGVSPFRVPGASTSTLRALREVAPDPRQVDPKLPAFVADAVRRSLSRWPEDRFPTAAALLEALEEHRQEVAVSSEPCTFDTDSGAIEIASGPTALVAAPDGPERAALADRLTRLGCAVTLASTGIAAMDEALGKKFSLVVLASALPGVDGLTACQLLRRSPASADTKIVVLVDPGNHDREIFARQVGATDVVRLPLNLHAFARTVRPLLE